MSQRRLPASTTTSPRSNTSARATPASRCSTATSPSFHSADNSVDVVVNFQVIEHLWDQGQFLRECFRVLAPGGELLISTPNRITFSPGRDTPLNPFHTRELNAAEMTELLEDAGFRVQLMTGVHHGSTPEGTRRQARRIVHQRADRPRVGR